MVEHPRRLPATGGGTRGSWAVFSPCHRYRYRLGRVWDPGDPVLGWVILHASAADNHHDDAVVRRCAGFARAWGYGGIEVGALYGIVSRQPAALPDCADPIGADNDTELAAIAAHRDLIVLAWGAGGDPDRAARVARMLRRAATRHGGSLAVLGWTPHGQPRHPLGVPVDTLPECCTPPPEPATASAPGVTDRRWALLVGSAA